MRDKQVCPLCGQEYAGYPALSRTDNRTLICPDCGTAQALHAIGVTDTEAVLRQIKAYSAREEAERDAGDKHD